MDFTNVINAIDRLVKNRVGAAAYTRMFIAVVQGVENTETNTYKISYDGGKTFVTAITITPDVNETIYKKGDSVQVLQLNGDGNTNLYILGKDSDISQNNIDKLDSYFIKENTHKVGNTLEFRLNDGNNIVETIKSFGSFIIGATFSVDDSKEVYNYGIKITLDFGQKGVTTYVFDTYQMLGQPWNYKNIRQEFKQKIDEFYCPYLEKITLGRFAAAGHEAQTEIKDIEISSALLHEANVYTAEFKGSKTGLDFITEKQAGKNNTTLQVLFYKNDVFFATENCKYYWFRRDESIDSGNEHYHRYGGKGWYLLNSIETQTSIDGDKEIPETIVKNNIGNSLQVSNEIAKQYHNYFKCVVEYGMYTATTEEKEILNLDSTALSFSLTTDSNVITKLDENTVLNIKLDLNDSDNQVNLIKWSYQKDNTGSREYIITEGTEKELNLANKTYTAATRKISNILGLQHTIFYCTLINVLVTSTTPIITTLGEAKIIITRDPSTELTEEIWYYNNGQSIVPPVRVDTTSWTTNTPTSGSIKMNYIFAASRMVSPTYKGPFGDIYCYSAHGTGAAAAQLTEFNRLTHNGKDRGLYYAKDDTKNKLYINADYINTGTLRVGDSNSEKFYASIKNKDVKIGGFTVNDTDLQWNNGSERVYLGREGLQLGSNFSIDQSGNVSWNSNNSPIRQIYCVNNTVDLPTDKDAYNKLPDYSDDTWHKIKSNNDKYYAQSSDGGTSWAGPFLIQGEKGESGKDGETETVKSVTIFYKATEEQKQPDKDDVGWVSAVTTTGFNETKRFLWIKQITTYSSNKTQEIIYLSSVWGKDGTSVNIKENKEACENIGDAYIDTDGNLQVLTKIDGEIKTFTPAGQIKGPKGDTGIGTANKIYYLLQTEGQTPNANTSGWEVDKPPLTEDTPILWQKLCYYYLESNTTTIPESASPYLTVVSILEEIPKRVICAYADTDSFISIKGNDLSCFKVDIEGYIGGDNKLHILTSIVKNDNGEIIERTFGKILDSYQTFYIPTIDTIIDTSKIYYKDKSGNIQTTPSTTGELKTCFEKVAVQKSTDSNGKIIYSIYDTATGNTGYFGTCEGRYLNTTTCNMIDPNKYSWSYYLTQLNRTNFMANVIDNAKDANGNYIDGIYTKEGSDGKNYIGINASAINTGSLKVTDGDANIIFNANISNNKVDIAGWDISKDKISKSGVALCSGNVNKNSLVTDSTSPIRVCAGYDNSDLTTSKFSVLDDGSLYASAANIEGKITTSNGNIGGWELGRDLFTNGSVGLYSGNKNVDTSLVNSTTTSPIRIFAGINLTISKLVFSSVESLQNNKSTFTDLSLDITEENEYFKLNPKVELGIDSTVQNYLQINGQSSILKRVSSKEEIKKYNNSFYTENIDGITIIYISKSALLTESKFRVLEDGSLYAAAASIEGNINATSGKIGSFEITPINNSSDYYKLIGTNTVVNNKYTTEIYPWGDDSSITLLEKDIAKDSVINQTKISLKNISMLGEDSHSNNIQNSISLSTTTALSSSTSEPLWPALYGYPRLIIGIKSAGGTGYPSTPYLTLNSSFGNLQGTWYKDNSSSITSSRNKKHDIEDLDDRYSTLFDNLNPVRFKYNNGQSDRYHTGLILDEMKNAMDAANINTSELAAYCVQDEKTGDGGIRYEELIALLIKEVQSLKTQVNVLTEKLNKLEEK